MDATQAIAVPEAVIRLAVGLLLAAMLVTILATLYRFSAPCPRCGKWFDGPRYKNPDPRLCSRCGIAIGTPKSAADDAIKKASA
jgi:hypothetical protein